MTADVTVAVGVVEAGVVVVDVVGVVDVVVVVLVEVAGVDVAAVEVVGVEVAGVEVAGVDAAAVVDVVAVDVAAVDVDVDVVDAAVVQLATTAVALVFRAVSQSELMLAVDEHAKRTLSSVSSLDLILSNSVLRVLLNCTSSLMVSVETTGQFNVVAVFAPACLMSTNVRAFTPASL